ncbi:hypothetical protein AGDE_09202 [Angomonas deanei]|nr:hypothetical protein AGDE_09202 [Angomonas deanei]|eukprot:EPY31142.1 hypothetical protein AGDE_09202 [Angomonas deanei]
MSLSRTFNSVDEKNRFVPLKILLDRFSGYVGRRQYKMNSDLSKYYDTLVEMGIDWHDLKYLSNAELRELLNERLGLDPSAKAVLLTAVHEKLCGVLKETSTRHSTSVCMNKGVKEHGWRCGRNGHTNDIYFERKQKANPAALQLFGRSSLRTAVESGVKVTSRSEPDFSIVGRLSVEANPRIWASPENPNFTVSPIGYEFRVHPEDPRAVPQIEEAAGEWELHLNVVRQVIWEMLELYGVEREPQSLDLLPGEMGPPDQPREYTSRFTVHTETGEDGEVSVEEQRLLTVDGKDKPWFQSPLEQQYENGVPTILPYAPSIIISSRFRQVRRTYENEDVTQQILQPVVDLTCYVHPNACFWWNDEDEEKCVKHILDYAKRLPYALPFNLYFRVDSTRNLRQQEEELNRRTAGKSAYF